MYTNISSESRREEIIWDTMVDIIKTELKKIGDAGVPLI
jgi:hypothetical protein